MLKLRKVAVTGNLNSGKSTVCQLLQKNGAFILNTDAVVHQLLRDPKIIIKITSYFGAEILDDNHQINRKKLSDIVFRDNTKLKRLENLLHPCVFDVIKNTYSEKSFTYPQDAIFAVEVPLLFEVGWQNWFDFIILVKADPLVRKKRFLSQGNEEKNFEIINSKQINSTLAETFSDAIITNNYDLIDLENQIQKILQTIKNHHN